MLKNCKNNNSSLKLTDLTMYRIIIGFAGLALTLLAVPVHSAINPLSERIFLSGLYLLLFILTYTSQWARDHVLSLLHVLMLITVIHTAIVVTRSQFALGYVISFFVATVFWGLLFKSGKEIFIFYVPSYLVFVLLYIISTKMGGIVREMTLQYVLYVGFILAVIYAGALLFRIRAQIQLQEKEHILRLLFDTGEQGLILCDAITGQPSECNTVSLRFFGFSVFSLPFTHFFQKFFTDVLEKKRADIEATLARKETWGDEFRYQSINGQPVWGYLELRPVMKDGRDFWFLYITDITENKIADEGATSSSIHNQPLPMIVVSSKGKVTASNRHFTRLAGYTAEQMKKLEDWKSFLFPEERDRNLVSGIINGESEESVFKPVEANVETAWKGMVPVRLHFSRQKDNWRLVFLDISSQRQAEKKLEETELRYRFLFDASSDAFFVFRHAQSSSQARIIEVNNYACNFLGYEREELLNINLAKVFNVLSPEFRQLFEEPDEFSCILFETEIITRSGKKIPVEVHTSIIEFNGEDVVLASVRDVSVRKEYQRRLNQQIRTLDQIIELNPYAIMIFDKAGRLIKQNRMVSTVLWRELPSDYVLYKDDLYIRNRLISTIRRVNNGEVVEIPELNLPLDGKELHCVRTILFPVNDSNHKVEFIVQMFEDISARKHVELQRIEYLNQMTKLQDFAVELLSAATENEIYDLIIRHLYDLIGKSILIYYSLDPDDNSFSLQAFEGLPMGVNLLAQKIGKGAQRIKMPLDWREIPYFQKNKLCHIKGGVEELGELVNSANYARVVKQIFRPGEIYCLSFFNNNDDLVGIVSIVLPENRSLENKEVIETYLNQASLALKQKIAEGKERKSLEEIRVLYELSYQFAYPLSLPELYSFIARGIRALSGQKYIGVSEYDYEKQAFRLKAVEGLEVLPKIIARKIEKYFFDSDFPVSLETLQQPDVSRLMPSEDRIVDLGGGRLDERESEWLEEKINFERIYQIAFVHEDNVLGSAIIIKQKDQPFGNLDLLETFMQQAAVALQRRLSEEALIVTRNAIESSMVGFFIAKPDNRITYVNSAFLEIVGYARSDVIGISFAKLAKNEKEAQNIIKLVLDHGNWYGTVKIIHKGGAIRDCEFSGSVVKDESGKPICVTASMSDITSRLVVERDLQKTLSELIRSNNDLKRFAYVASHDLQEPLRTISSYLQLLDKRYKGRLDTDADDFINFAVDGAKRLKDLINDLLVYSRLGKEKTQFEPVNLNEVVSEVLVRLKNLIEEAAPILDIGKLPVVRGYRGQMLQLFQNLITNALKYRSERRLRLEIRAEQDGRFWVFSVKDNGIGIEQQHYEKIFEIFQRLHTQEHFPGTGIGLALCKRIVEEHQGRIWVSSYGGNGSTFFFTLPVYSAEGDSDGNREDI